VTADGWQAYHLPFSGTVTNLLVVAPTRTGKTTLLRTLVYGLAAQNPERRLQLALVDLKSDDLLADFESLAHLRYPVATEVGDAVAVLQELAGEVERRSRGAARRPAHIFVVLDEVIALVQDRQFGTAATEALTPILTRGGGLGIYTVATTQRADKRSLSDPLIVSQFTNRIVGKVASGQESALAAGRGEMNAHKLLGRGDFVALVNGEVTRVQVAQTSSELVARLPTWTVAPPMPARPEPEPERGPGRPPDPVDPQDVELVRQHVDQCNTLGAVQRLLGGGRLKSRTYAERAAVAAGLVF
jgi:DNA segregation ATPase FtsK/SpoIIIE-like protein